MGNDVKSSGKDEPPASIVVQGEVYMRQGLIGETIANLERQRGLAEEAKRRYEQMQATVQSADEGLAQQVTELGRQNAELTAQNRDLEQRLQQMTQEPSTHSPIAVETTDHGGRLSSPMIDVSTFTEQYEGQLREQATRYDTRIAELTNLLAEHEGTIKGQALTYRELEQKYRKAAEDLGKAEETINKIMVDLRQANDRLLDMHVASEARGASGEDTLIGATEPVAPEQLEAKAAGIYETLAKTIIERSQFSTGHKRSAYFKRLTEQDGVPAQTASRIVIDVVTDAEIYAKIVEEGKKLDTTLDSIFRARHALDERRAQIAPLIQRAEQLPAEEARLRELGDGLEARAATLSRSETELAGKVRKTEAELAEKARQKEEELAAREASINKSAIEAADLHTREMKESVRKTANELRHKEEDLQNREIEMEKGAAAIREGTQAMKELALRFRKYYERQAEFTKRLRDLMQDNMRGYQARVDNIKAEKGIGGVVILLSEIYLKKTPKREGADTQDTIYSGLDAEAITKLRKLVRDVPKADQQSLRQDDAMGHYIIHPVLTDNNLPIAYFCMTGIPDETKSDQARMDDLLKTATAVKHALLTEYTTMHMLSEEGELGYINSRLGSLERSLGLEQKQD